MMMTTHTAGEDCPSKMKPICTKIKTIHNGEQGQGGGPSNATPCAADFHEFFTPAPQSQCYVHAKTKRIWVLHDDFILLPLCLNGSIRHFLLGLISMGVAWKLVQMVLTG